MDKEKELLVITKMYDYLKWVSPIINRLPRDRKYSLGDRFLNRLYDSLEDMIRAKYRRTQKVEILEKVNINLEICRYYQRLLYEENLWSIKRYKYSSEIINEVGKLLGNWIKSIRKR